MIIMKRYLFFIVMLFACVAVSAQNTARSQVGSLHIVKNAKPDYNKLLNDELDSRMEEWQKQMPGESLQEYNIRTSEENTANQKRLFEEEIATRLSDNMVQMADIQLGNYNPKENVLALHFDNMPDIFLPVPSEDLNDFMDPGNLEFRNSKYGITEDNSFELVYADVYNKVSDKTYTYDNRERKTYDYMTSSDDFVPLQLAQQSSMESLRLQEIKESVVAEAKQENTITDHTNISVKSEAIAAFDADGRKITNYKVDFEYAVEPEFSTHEDFAPGRYKSAQSPAAVAMLAIIRNAFENDFAQYVKEGKRLQINIGGMADALPINGRIPYDGCYGDFTDYPVYKNNQENRITVTKASGITHNEQLAFLRATGVKEYISENIPALKNMDTDYRININLQSGTGGAYRRITVDFIFVDAF